MNKYYKALTLLSLTLAFSPTLLADKAKTNNGIEIYKDENYWFKMHGIVKADAVFFIDDHDARQNEFPSGTNLRAIETSFEGGIGKDISYSVSLSFENGVSISDAYLTFSGLKNTQINIGQVISPFCLENANSGKWIPFLERSLPVVTFAPCMGIGAYIKHWGEHYTIHLASTTPFHGTNRDTATIKHRSDRLTNTARVVFRPIYCDDYLIQIGASGVYAENKPDFRDGTPNIDGRRFSSRPEARARNTPSLVNTGNRMFVDNIVQWGAEWAFQRGPLLIETEYLHTNVDRRNLPTLNFYGWHAQVAYVLTGETREYSKTSGTFGRVNPRCPTGAWEIAARYSMVNLNDEDLHGGKENNLSIGLNWFYNKHLMFRANYIHANIDPTQALRANNPSPHKRNLHIFGTRMQVVW